MTKPEPHDFGITPRQVQAYRMDRSALQERILNNLGFPSVGISIVVSFSVVLLWTGSLKDALMAGWLGLFPGGFIAFGLAHLN